MSEIDCGVCRLRPWRMSDAAALTIAADNPRIAANMRDLFPHPYRRKDAERFITSVKDAQPVVHLAIAVDDVPLGGLGAMLGDDVFRCSAEIGYWLSEDYWGHGIMSGAVRGFVGYLFQQLPLSRVFAGVFDGNIPSMRVLEKVGFRRESIQRQSIIKQGQIRDRVIYALLRSEWQSSHGGLAPS